MNTFHLGNLSESPEAGTTPEQVVEEFLKLISQKSGASRGVGSRGGKEERE